jgi:hypothetical protein
MFTLNLIHWHQLSINYIHELAVEARQVDSAAQLVIAPHWNRRAASSTPATGLIVAFFAAAAPSQKMYTIHMHLKFPSRFSFVIVLVCIAYEIKILHLQYILQVLSHLTMIYNHI